MRNAPHSSPEPAKAPPSRSGGVFDRRFAIKAGLAGLLCLSIPGDVRIERKEAPTPRQVLDALIRQGIEGARTVTAPVVPEEYRHVFLHIPQRHQVMIMDKLMQRAVKASQGDIQTMLLDLQRRFGLRDVYPENMVPKNLEDSRLFARRENPEQEFLDAIALQKGLLADARKRGEPEEHTRLLEQMTQRNVAEFERELALVRRLGKDGYNEMKFDALQRSDAEFDAPLKLELAGGIRRKMCGTDAALTRAGEMRRQFGLKHPAVLDEREDDAIRTILSQAEGPLLAVPYGSAHDFTNNVLAHNARRPDQAMALVVAEPLSHAVIRLPTE
jgi:hypothetical protein